MKLTVQGQGDVTLTQRDFVAAGGEGQVFAKGKVAYKVYSDPAKMIPLGKIQELAGITDPQVVKPERVLLDPKGLPVGYTMSFVKDALVLCQLFPRAFREREGLDHKQTFALVQKMQAGVEHIHRAGVLLVDPNEMNFLVDPAFQQMFFIDADSYQTRNYPATAIMESVRDRHMRHAHDFNEGTDWFGFACTSFQLLVGIHPYKGKHPSLSGFDERMRANVSVLNSDVRVPAATYSFDVIPPAWRAWYEAVFERGERCAPPTGTVAVFVRPVMQGLAQGQHVTITELLYFDAPVRRVWPLGLSLGVLTEDGLWQDKRSLRYDPRDIVAVGRTPAMNRVVAVKHQPGQVPLLLHEGVAIPFGLAAQQVMAFQGRFYLRAEDRITEVLLSDVGDKVLASPRVVANVLPQASLMFQGGVYQNALGSAYVHLFPKSGMALQVRLPELDGYKVVEAKHDCAPDGTGSVLVMVAAKGGKYTRFVYRVDSTGAYDVRKVEDITPTGLNFVVLDKGICVLLNEEENLELFSCQRGQATLKVVEDKALSGDMTLTCRGGEVLFHRGQRVYSMKMR